MAERVEGPRLLSGLLVPCRLGDLCECDGSVPSCRHWIPSRRSKHFHCMLFELDRFVCDRPKSDCARCENYLAPGRSGRPTSIPAKTGETEEDRRRRVHRDRIRRYRLAKKMKRLSDDG